VATAFLVMFSFMWNSFGLKEWEGAGP